MMSVCRHKREVDKKMRSVTVVTYRDGHGDIDEMCWRARLRNVPYPVTIRHASRPGSCGRAPYRPEGLPVSTTHISGGSPAVCWGRPDRGVKVSWASSSSGAGEVDAPGGARDKGVKR